jgi:hypothetical protein
MGRFLKALFGPTDRWVFVLIIARKPTRNDLPPTEDFLGRLPYNKVAVVSEKGFDHGTTLRSALSPFISAP